MAQMDTLAADRPARPTLASRWPLVWRTGGIVVVAVVALVASFELVYAGKVFPGVHADGAYLGGLSSSAAADQLKQRTIAFAGDAITITNGKQSTPIPVASLGVSYDTARATDLAFAYGRQGSVWRRATEQLRALVGRSTSFAAYSYSDAKLAPYVSDLVDDAVTPATDAKLSFAGGQATVVAGKTGTRVDFGALLGLVEARLAATSTNAVTLPIYQLQPGVNTADLQKVTASADTYVAAPITLSYNNTTKTIDPATIITWLAINHSRNHTFTDTLKLQDLFTEPITASVLLDPTAVTSYVASLASDINQAPQNAGLDMENGQLVVTSQAVDGVELDQASAIKAIASAVTKPAEARSVALSVKTTQAPVRADNLASLGITDLLSEGETYFPGSPSTRLTNVRAGAKQFNNVLLAPGEQFSFGKILGDVGPAEGYVPELVILGDHEEKQYGGGLCQVSSTAFRAALLAGLPINERVNHAFAISYYTWPYAAPGVDATIYYPQVDFKFTNDTGHYILIQTHMSGVDLKFDYYGTKTKTGVIIPPVFVSGSNDAKQASHTVFYRQVLDLAGNVTKTDTFNTYYKPSTDYPVVTTSGYN